MVSPYAFETPDGKHLVVVSYGDHDLNFDKPKINVIKSQYKRTPSYLNPNRHKRPQRRSKYRQTSTDRHRVKSRRALSAAHSRRRASHRSIKKTRGYHSPGRGPPGRSSPTRTKSKSRSRRKYSRRRKGYFWSRKHRKWIRSKYNR